MLEPKAPPARNGPNTERLAPRVKRRVNKKKIVNLNKFSIQTLLLVSLIILNVWFIDPRS